METNKLTKGNSMKDDTINIKISEELLVLTIAILGDSLKDEPTTVGQRNKQSETILARRALRKALDNSKHYNF
jgi:hypothetical protein